MEFETLWKFIQHKKKKLIGFIKRKLMPRATLFSIKIVNDFFIEFSQ